MNKTKRNPTTVQIIAEKFNVKSSYVRSILKIGRIKPLNFMRILEGRMSVFAAYNDAKKEEKGDIPDVPKVKDIVYYQTSTQPIGDYEYSNSLEVKDTDNVSMSEYDQAFSQNGVSTILIDDGEPTSDLKQVKFRSSGKKPHDNNQKSHISLQRVDEDRIQFICPCGCKTNIIINHKNLKYEKA